MKTTKGDMEPKNKIKSSSSRQAFKLGALNPNPIPRKISQNARPLNSGDNSKSALLRQLKAHSHKMEEEPHFQPPSRSILQKIENNERRKDKENSESKDNCRSFMIRKKNISTYARKLEEDLTKYEIDLLNLPRTHENILEPSSGPQPSHITPQQSQTNSNSNSSNDIKDPHPKVAVQRQMLRSSVLNHSTGLKVKPIICKPHKEQEHSISSGGKEQPDKKIQKHIEKLIRKVRNSSKSQYQAPKSNPSKEFHHVHAQNNKENGDLPIKIEEKLKEEKGKGFNGCKTIRITWGKAIEKENIDKVGQLPDKDDIFGGISVITHCREGQIQSLKQLFKELNHSPDVISVVSKQLIEF